MSLLERAEQQRMQTPNLLGETIANEPFRFTPAEPDPLLSPAELVTDAEAFQTRVTHLHAVVVEQSKKIETINRDIEITETGITDNDGKIVNISEVMASKYANSQQYNDQCDSLVEQETQLLPTLDSAKSQYNRARDIYFDKNNVMGLTAAERLQAQYDYLSVTPEALSGPSQEISLFVQIQRMERDLALIRERQAACRNESSSAMAEYTDLTSQRDALHQRGQELRDILARLMSRRDTDQAEARRLLAVMQATLAVIGAQMGDGDGQ